MPIKDLNASPNGTLVLQHENIPLHRWKLTVKQDDKRIFLYMLYHWMELGENILNNSFEDHLRKWWQTALKNTYLMDKLKFHKNICNLNQLISNKCKNFCFRERQDQNTMLYDRNTVIWTVELFHPYVYLFKVLKKI